MSDSASRRPLLIVNPRSSGGKTGRLFDQMREPISRAIGELDVSFTERGRHAVEIAREAALAGREAVIAVGGDGSIHEVVNGLMEAREQGATRTRFGVIGQGTGGDFRKTLGIEHRLDLYCKAIAEGKTRAIDVGKFSYAAHDGSDQRAYFVNILSVGIGGLVDQLVAEANRSLGGTLAYFSASVRGLLKSEIGVLEATIRHRGEERVERIRTRNLAICNGRYFGSGMHVAPMAKLDDGVFEVVNQGAMSRLKFAMVSSKVYTGEHLQNPEVSHFACDKLTLVLENTEIADRFLLDVDGEPLGRLPITVELVPGAIEVFVPAA